MIKSWKRKKKEDEKEKGEENRRERDEGDYDGEKNVEKVREINFNNFERKNEKKLGEKTV